MAKIPEDIFRAIVASDPNFGSLSGLESALLAGTDPDDASAMADELLHPQFETGQAPSFKGGTQLRGPDVDINDRGEVLANNKGTSMHSKAGFFGWNGVSYFCVPENTAYSEDQLTLHKSRNRKKPLISGGYTGKAAHYNICPKNPMRPDALRGALANLARAAVAQACQDGKSVRLAQSDDDGAGDDE